MMNRLTKFRLMKLDVEQVRPVAAVFTRFETATKHLRIFSHGISFKLAMLIITLLALTSFGISLAVISIMDDLQLQSMIERGAAVTTAAASTASFNILAEDRLALDNLVSRIGASQPDLDYIAIVDVNGRIVAHNHLELSGQTFSRDVGVPIGNRLGLDVRKLRNLDSWTFEFTTPITFHDNTLGQVVAGINDSGFNAVRTLARNRIILIISLLLPLAIAAAFLLARLFTYPVERLTEGVELMLAGEDQVIVPITSNDELAILTHSFNDMAKKLAAQRRSLVNYSEELEQSYADIVKILAAALDARDNYTYGHSARVARLSVAVGRKLALKPYELKDLEMTCLLHDIGKIRIPDNILNKPGKLNRVEYQHIQDHPYHGVQILDLTDSLKKYIPAVMHHHEWHDGTGYPGSLAGEEIPLYARILSIADAYDAMTSSRPYRQGMPRDAAVTELCRFRGSQFEPELVDLFVEALDEYGDTCDIPLDRMVTC